MIGRVLAVALTTAVTVCADNCAQVNSAFSLQSDLTNKRCNGGDTATCDFKTCHCSNCCQYVKDSCLDKAAKGDTCPDGKVRDNNVASTVVASGSNFVDTCCKEGHTCEKESRNALKAAKHCPSSQLVPLANMGTTVNKDLSDYKANCCVDVPMCDIECPAGYKDKPAKTAIKCTSIPCAVQTCCDHVANKCASNAMAGKSCTDANRYVDPNKFGEDVKADGSDFDLRCCADKATCEAFKGATIGTAAASGASNRFTVTLSLLLAVVGRMVM